MDSGLFLLLGIINGLIFGTISAIVAKNKQHSAGSGFLYGFLLGIFGLIIVISQAPSTRQKIARGEMKICVCGNAVLSHMNFCPVCGSDLSFVQPNVQYYDQLEQIKTRARNQKLMIVGGALAGFFILFVGFRFVDYQLAMQNQRMEMQRQSEERAAVEATKEAVLAPIRTESAMDAIDIVQMDEDISILSAEPNSNCGEHNTLTITLVNQGDKEIRLEQCCGAALRDERMDLYSDNREYCEGDNQEGEPLLLPGVPLQMSFNMAADNTPGVFELWLYFDLQNGASRREVRKVLQVDWPGANKE